MHILNRLINIKVSFIKLIYSTLFEILNVLKTLLTFIH